MVREFLMGLIDRIESRRLVRTVCMLACWIVTAVAAQAAPVKVMTAKSATARELYGAEKLRGALAELKSAPNAVRVLVAVRSAPELSHFDLPEFSTQAE